jgi:hypothetical protein
MRRSRCLLIFALLFRCLPGEAQALPEPPLARETGRAMARQAIDLVEQQGLPPRSQAEYQVFKTNLLHLVDEQGDTIDRQQLYLRLQLMLNTLDSDNHTFLTRTTPAAPDGHNTSGMPGAGAVVVGPDAARTTALLNLIATPRGKVLHITPPQILTSDGEHTDVYLARGLAQITTSKLPDQACAIVIDLSQQKGGNGWPPLGLLRPLFSATNSARFVERNNHRIPVLPPTFFGDATPSPLTRFAGAPLAFVMNGETSSAGEMIAVALLGEGERVRSFGWPSNGRTTANRTFPLPDNASLVLSGARYALADEPVIRGKIVPQAATAAGSSMEDVLLAAATWAADRSRLCNGSAR